MNIPSRYMPRAIRKTPAAGTWLILALLVLAGATIAALSRPVMTGLGAAVVVALVLWGAGAVRREKARLAALADTRRGETICQFARSFDARAVDTWVIRAVYEQVQGLLHSTYASFPLRASDRLQDLGIDTDDIEMELAVSLSKSTGRSLDKPKANPFFGTINTVSDLVMFFNAQPLVVERRRSDLSIKSN
jgi:hypothetical protein